MVIVDDNIANQICEVLPSLKELVEKDETDYEMIFVSIFDHWLTMDEFESNIHTEDSLILTERRTKLITFLKELFYLATTFKVNKIDGKKIEFSSFENVDEIVEYCNIEEQNGECGQRYDIIIPEYQAIYSEEWDWTNIIWFRNKSLIKPIIDLVQKNGLYTLTKGGG